MSTKTLAEIAAEKAQSSKDDQDKIVGYVAIEGDVDGQSISRKLNIPIDQVFKHLAALTTAKVLVARGSPCRYNVTTGMDTVKLPVKDSTKPLAKTETTTVVYTGKTVVNMVLESIQEAKKPINAETIAKELGKDKKGICNACSQLVRKRSIQKVGKKPYSYIIPTEEITGKLVTTSVSKLKSGETIISKVVSFLEKHTEYMSIDKMVHVSGLKRSQVAPVISGLKKDNKVEILGDIAPFKYKLKTDKKDSQKVAEKKPVIKEKPPVKQKRMLKVSPFDDDYLIGFTTAKSEKPTFVTEFKDTADFINQFEDLQKIEGVDEICAFKRMTLNERIIFTPDV